MKFIKYIVPMLAVVSLFSCESLQDTLGEEGNSGKIRYVGMVSDLKADAGWERLLISWENSIDPNIENIKLEWRYDEVIDSVILDKEETEFVIDDLAINSSVEINVVNLDAEGNESLPVLALSRPYNFEHESYTSYTTLVEKYFITPEADGSNRVNLFFTAWNENVTEAHINYYDMSGEVKSIAIDSAAVVGLYMSIEDVKATGTKADSIWITRRGTIGESIDTIPEVSTTLSLEPVFSSDFRNLLIREFGLESETVKFDREFCATIEEFSVDYTIYDLREILYFPNLKVLKLGSNRYMLANQDLDYMSEVNVSRLHSSQYALEQFDMINPSFRIERYASHYNTLIFNLATTSGGVNVVEMGLPVLPIPSTEYEYVTIPTLNPDSSTDAAWILGTNHPDTDISYDSKLWQLFDGNNATSWNPIYSSEGARSFEIVLDSKEAIDIDGFVITQTQLQEGDFESEALQPSTIRIQKSDDGQTWTDISPDFTTYTLGRSSGESTFITFRETVKSLQIKFIITDNRISSSSYDVELADIKYVIKK